MKKMINNNKGFTMLELIMVVIIISVLATLAIPSYGGFVEKARSAEAVSTISAIRTAQNLYKLESSKYASALDDISIQIPQGGATYWEYSISNASETSFSVTATRSSKKASSDFQGKTIMLDWNDSSGEKWSGTHIGVPK